jgi:hypothetical protein
MLSKKILFFFIVVLVSTFAFAQNITVGFQASNEAFKNPERGFFTWTSFLTDSNFLNVTAAGNTLTRPYIRLDQYRDSALPQPLLDGMSAGFEKARAAGIKVIVRFAYNWGPYPNSDPDASKDRIKQHLLQIAPILAANEDTIYSMEAGFVGAWGEWHTSTNGIDTNTSAKAEILTAILAALPKSRFVSLRYPSDQWTLNGSPITAAESFKGTNRARVGSHNDCFLASADDWGTWGRLGLHTIEQDKTYVATNSLYSVVGGETCNVNPPRSDCYRAVAELARYHFSYLNADYLSDVLNTWKAQGCYDQINRRLGYRIHMKKAYFPKTVTRGNTFRLQVDIANTGFAAPMNARPVYVVFTSGTSTVYTFKQSVDPRRWAAGKSQSLVFNVALPTTMKPGTYAVHLWLPDESSALSSNSAYAIRLANNNTWNDATGYNKIYSGISIR